MASAIKVKLSSAYPKYAVLQSAMANGIDFNDGDTRSIRYEGDDYIIDQVFCGNSVTGGWYDL